MKRRWTPQVAAVMLETMDHAADALSTLLTCRRWLDNARCGTAICSPRPR
ncbi:hypothetical protein [Actinokineospora terrae]|nr:hypothetical protein [Actinokineospora terrae]